MAEAANMGSKGPRDQMQPDGDHGSIWALKPWWCQPWSIVLTGAVSVAGSWWALHRWWITAPVALAVVLWWAVFLVLVPASYRQQLDSPN